MSKRFLSLLICLLYCLVNMSCTGVSARKKNEPAVFFIRNSSGHYIEEVVIHGDRQANRHTRMGAISPLPAGVTQVFGRPSNAPGLPGKINICWGADAANLFCKKTEISSVLKSSYGPGNAIVIDILSASEVKVYLEKKPGT